MAGDDQIIAIGDIHGCFRSLKALMSRLDDYRDYRFVFIGDYIDRGPRSREVVDFLIELEKNRECIFLRGNHEQMLLDAVEQGNADSWAMNGVDATLSSYGLEPDKLKFPQKHMEFYKNTALYFESDSYFFVHAGLPPFNTISQSTRDPASEYDYLWTREHLSAPENSWEKTVVFGHTPQKQPMMRENMIGIDTGCVFSEPGFGRLTALIMPEETFVQQVSLDNDER